MVWLTDVFLIVLGEQWNYMVNTYGSTLTWKLFICVTKLQLKYVFAGNVIASWS